MQSACLRFTSFGRSFRIPVVTVRRVSRTVRRYRVARWRRQHVLVIRWMLLPVDCACARRAALMSRILCGATTAHGCLQPLRWHEVCSHCIRCWGVSPEEREMEEPNKSAWSCCSKRPPNYCSFLTDCAAMPCPWRRARHRSRSRRPWPPNRWATSLSDAIRSVDSRASLDGPSIRRLCSAHEKGREPSASRVPALVGRLRTVVWWRWAESNRRPEALHPQHYMLSPPLDLISRQHGWQSAPGNQPALSNR